MEVVLPTKAHGTLVDDIPNDFVDHETNNDNVVEKYIVTISLGSNNDQLTLPSQVTPASWLVEAMMNIKMHGVLRTNEESMNKPSQPVELNNEIVHFFMDNRSMEEDSTHNEESYKENNIVQSVVPDIK